MSWHGWHIRASRSPRLGHRSMRFFNFSHPSTSAPRGFHLQTGRENCPEEGETSALSLSGIRECKYTTNKFLLEHNRGLGRQGDEMRKRLGGSLNKSRCRAGPPIGFKENPLHLISCPRVFKLQHKTSPGEFRQWAREEASEGKRRGRKMRA